MSTLAVLVTELFVKFLETEAHEGTLVTALGKPPIEIKFPNCGKDFRVLLQIFAISYYLQQQKLL